MCGRDRGRRRRPGRPSICVGARQNGTAGPGLPVIHVCVCASHPSVRALVGEHDVRPHAMSVSHKRVVCARARRARHFSPQEVDALRYAGITLVAAAGQFSAFVSVDGSVLMCGCGWDGQLGSGDRDCRLLPELVQICSDGGGGQGGGGRRSPASGDESEDGAAVMSVMSWGEEQGTAGAVAIKALAAGAADVLSQVGKRQTKSGP